MSLTQGLAAIGAVTGVAGALLGILAFVRDRARLVLRGQLSSHNLKDEDETYIYMYVINSGRQPIAIVSAGILNFPTGVLPIVAKLLLRRFVIGGLDTGPGAALSPTNDQPIVMQPGELRRFVAQGAGYEYGKIAPKATPQPGLQMGPVRVPVLKRSWSTYLYAVDALGRVRIERLELRGLADEWRTIREEA